MRGILTMLFLFLTMLLYAESQELTSYPVEMEVSNVDSSLSHDLMVMPESSSDLKSMPLHEVEFGLIREMYNAKSKSVNSKYLKKAGSEVIRGEGSIYLKLTKTEKKKIYYRIRDGDDS